MRKYIKTFKLSPFYSISFYIWTIVMLLGVTGYVLDIIKLVHCDFLAPYKGEILYGLGAVSGLGAIFGWFSFGK